MNLSLFCHHNYELINQFIIDSEFDIVRKGGLTPNTFQSLIRKYVTDYKCVTCGKLKRFVEKTYK